MDTVIGHYLGLANRILVPLAIIMGFFFIGKAGYTLMTSQGAPDAVNKGKEDLTSAIMGLLFVVLSAIILRVVIISLLGETPF